MNRLHNEQQNDGPQPSFLLTRPVARSGGSWRVRGQIPKIGAQGVAGTTPRPDFSRGAAGTPYRRVGRPGASPQ